MFIQDDFHVENQIQGTFEEDWYMNKLSGSRVIKILNSANERNGKVRSLEDIAMQFQKSRRNKGKPDHAPYAWYEYGDVCSPNEETELQACTLLDGVMEDRLPEECNAESGTNGSLEQCRQAWIETSDDDIENMTIKEMQHFLKKATRKPFKNQALPLPSNGNEPSTSRQNCPSESIMPMVAFELQLDSSHSNSADSVDDTTGDGSADSKPEMLCCETKILTSGVGDVGGSALKTREPDCQIFAGVASEAEGTEDEWTLEMWQSHHKQHSRKRKFKAIDDSEGQNALEEIPNRSMLPLINSDPVCAWQTGSLADFPTSSTVPLVGASPEDLGIQGSPSVEAQDSGSNEEGDDLLSETLPGDQVFEKCQDSRENNSEVHDASLAPATVKLVLEDESESTACKAPSLDNLQTENGIIGTWALKPCRNKAAGVSPGILSKPTVQHELIDACDRSDRSESNDIGSSNSGQDPGDVISTDGNGGSKKMEPGSIRNDIANTVAELSGSVTDLSNDMTQLVEPAEDLLSKRHDSAQSVDHIIEQQVKPGNSDSRKDPSSTECFAKFAEFVERTAGNLGANYEAKGDVSELPGSLLAIETLDVEEELGLIQRKPATLSCKRKAISPSSQEKLLQASNFGCGFNDLENQKGLRAAGPKRLSRYFKGYVGQDGLNREWLNNTSIRKRSLHGEHSYESSSPTEIVGQKGEALPGSPCHNKDLSHIWQKIPSSKPLLLKRIVPAVIPSQHSPSHAQSVSLVPSPPAQQTSNGTPPLGLSPVIPARGILRSASQSCCSCEDCASVRSRAEKASEFAQRQMHDIEGLAVRLMKELGTMRGIVEEKLLQGPRSQSSYSGPTLEQVKQATNGAVQTEERTKKWLARMARDCNRYCKIMRMQQRRLTFADESGGQLCQIRVFHSQADSEPFTSTSEQNEAIPSPSLEGCNSNQDD